jgi:uncharacterized protein YbbK (DUF523 family)
VSFWRRQLFHHPESCDARPLVATSACLLGEPVRYDGGHKLQSSIENWLAPHLQLEAICPEVGIGLPVPRPTLKLVGDEGAARVVGVEDESIDVTAALRDYAEAHLGKIGRFWPLCAWIFKARSPSCGLGSTPLNPGAIGESAGSGAFAGRIAGAARWLPVYEEEDLQREEQCQELLLLSFIARDILWQASGDFPGLREHYRRLLSPTASPFGAGDSPALWREVHRELTGMGNEKRRELVHQYRAA